MTYAQVRSELVEATGNPKVTVPTLEVDGRYITDSWVIAEYVSGWGGYAKDSSIKSMDCFDLRMRNSTRGS